MPEWEFEAIHELLLQTERGRRFLAEHARRRRSEDVARLHAVADRIDAHVRGAEAERARRRRDGERAAEVVRQLAEVLNDLRPLADARVRARALESREIAKASGLERRFAALVELEDGDISDEGLKLFG